ncbi:hypothetical protein WISP_81860 [Willisornis vidua]|uniref:Uncharacterized protein n=1 Tax=Willisornis vidua TaxID=1566151 RepID=A0ABQ9DA53_9PASS|nr:hypothetical protein WISP_81860 [Willisornis vidua]
MLLKSFGDFLLVKIAETPERENGTVGTFEYLGLMLPIDSPWGYIETACGDRMVSLHLHPFDAKILFGVNNFSDIVLFVTAEDTDVKLCPEVLAVCPNKVLLEREAEVAMDALKAPKADSYFQCHVQAANPIRSGLTGMMGIMSNHNYEFCSRDLLTNAKDMTL